MYKKEFESLLKSPALPRCIMLFGEDLYFIEKFINQIISRYENALVLKQYFLEFDLKQAVSHLSTPGLFSDYSILLIKTDKKLDTKTFKELINACLKNPNASLIIDYQASDAKEKSKLFTSKDTCFVRTFMPNFSQAFVEAKNIALDLGLNISDKTINHLVIKHSLDLSTAKTDLQKFAYTQNLSEQEALELITSFEEASVDKLITALIKKEKIIHLAYKISQELENHTAFLAILSANFTRLFIFRLYIQKNARLNSKEILGYQLPIDVEKKLGEMAIKINLKTFEKIFDLLSDCDFNLKTNSKIDKEAIFFSLLIRLEALFL